MNERRVERVARAICWKRGIDPDMIHAIHAVGWGKNGLRTSKYPAWHDYVKYAEAAIEALSACLTPEYESSCTAKREDSFVELD